MVQRRTPEESGGGLPRKNTSHGVAISANPAFTQTVLYDYEPYGGPKGAFQAPLQPTTANTGFGSSFSTASPPAQSLSAAVSSGVGMARSIFVGGSFGQPTTTTTIQYTANLNFPTETPVLSDVDVLSGELSATTGETFGTFGTFLNAGRFQPKAFFQITAPPIEVLPVWFRGRSFSASLNIQTPGGGDVTNQFSVGFMSCYIGSVGVSAADATTW